MRRNGIAGFFALAALAVLPASAEDLDARGLYRAALAAMQTVREPAFLTYRTTIPGGNGAILVSRDEDGTAEFAVVAGTSVAQSWDVSYRDADGVASIAMPDGRRAISHLAIFDPTWRGAYTWLRRGFGASVVVETPPPQSPQPGASPGSQMPLPVLAVVRAIDVSSYDVRDGGAQACPDGRAGRRLWTAARGDPQRYPLTGATVDTANKRFCALRFHEHLPNPSVTFDLDVDLALGPVGPYYLITGGRASGAVRPYRRPGWFQFDASFAYDRFAFPRALPAALFEPEATATP